MQLRPYQQSACDAALEEMRASIEPCLIDAAPAAGKSFMIGYIANALNKISGGKRVLCLAPSAELVKQNHEKFLLTGERASIFSASAGTKSTRHVVVFGTPKTVQNAISRFREGYCAVIVDEAHGITPTIRAIIEAMRAANPNLRILGLSGTPFRMGSGFIFRSWPDGRLNGDDKARDPYFAKCVYRVSAREMLDQGYITPMGIGAINAAKYDTSALEMLPNGTFNPSTVERAFEGHGRETAAVVADVIHQARNRPGGIMYFAATVRHAHEIMASLPTETSALVTGDTCMMGGRDCTSKAAIDAYRSGKVRHLVSVGALTTGFDVSHTEVIATLRRTESAALLQQILGRAWRLHDGKTESLWLDYADNADTHFPDGDIYNPDIKAGKAREGGGACEAECPECGQVNEFSRHKDYLDFVLDKHGYCLDAFGAPMMSEYGPVPGHHGRRCFGQVRGAVRGSYERCGYFWTSKECPECQHKNDIAARFCRQCKAELINPNDKLVADFKAMKKDPTRLQTDEVLNISVTEGTSKNGNKILKVTFDTTFRNFTVWFMPESTHTKGRREYAAFTAATMFGAQPKTVTYRMDPDTKFYTVLGYDRPVDALPEGLAA